MTLRFKIPLNTTHCSFKRKEHYLHIITEFLFGDQFAGGSWRCSGSRGNAHSVIGAGQNCYSPTAADISMQNMKRVRVFHPRRCSGWKSEKNTADEKRRTGCLVARSVDSQSFTTFVLLQAETFNQT